MSTSAYPRSQFLSFSRLPAVKARFGLSRPQIYKLMAAKQFPAQISLGGGRAVAWLDSELDEWAAARIAESRSAASAPASKLPAKLRARQQQQKQRQPQQDAA